MRGNALPVLMLTAYLFLAPQETAGQCVADILSDFRNREVTVLGEDCESARLALGAAWDDALATRAISAYLRPWTYENAREQSEGIVRRGAALYEHVSPSQAGISPATAETPSRPRALSSPPSSHRP